MKRRIEYQNEIGMKWKIEYDNDTGPTDEHFREWWTVTDGEKSFESNNEDDAEWLCAHLNDEELRHSI